MGKKASTSTVSAIVDPATTKRARAVTEIDDIFASKKSKSIPSAPIAQDSVKLGKGKGKAVAERSGTVGKGEKVVQGGTKDTKGKGKEIVVVSTADDAGEVSDGEEESSDEEAEEWALLEAEEQAKVDAEEKLKLKRVVQEVVDPSTAIDAFRNTAGPPVVGKVGTGRKGGVEGKAEEAEDRFMDSRGTSRASASPLRADCDAMILIRHSLYDRSTN